MSKSVPSHIGVKPRFAAGVSEHILKLAEVAGMKNQISKFFEKGRYETAILYIRELGEALAQEMNAKRPEGISPYAFDGLLQKVTYEDEDEGFLHALQNLFLALTCQPATQT